ncbi:hypothetical protein SAMN06893096_11039 [Geodermatophilus pulveris]|uniref:Uncharacterized protein n=1 Tax=Geodermatophilus pulveris TaxID=1564159 RepID=A0A239I7S6_9ACTN|nr:hypothetical protein [Geodermatophilus pulveris]SNS89685.1 hypothetical protein SAMN06893096_11039 [Geodermatophilus pulveris]
MTDTDTTTEQTTHTPEAEEHQGGSDREFGELARTQQDVAQRARQLVAGDLAARAQDGGDADERTGRLVTSTRADLAAELREQEQEEARRHLERATRSSEDAVTGVVQGITTIVRSVVPAVLVRPEDVIEATYGLADQGLRVTRRLALTMAGSLRNLSQAA